MLSRNHFNTTYQSKSQRLKLLGRPGEKEMAEVAWMRGSTLIDHAELSIGWTCALVCE
jgi:hypothetical protein